MAPQSQEEVCLDDFKRRTAPFLGTWTSFDVRFSAVLQGETWSNLFTRAELRWDRVPRRAQLLAVDQPTFRAGRLIMPSSEAMDWLSGVPNRNLALDGFQLRLGHVNRREGMATSGQVTGYGWNVWKMDRYGALRTPLYRDPEWEQGIELMGSGDQAYSLLPPDDWGKVNDLLLSSSGPYAGLEDFSSSYLGYRQPRTINHSVSFEVEAVYGAMFQEYEIEGGEFKVTLLHPPKVLPGDIQVAAVLTTASETRRFHIQPTTTEDTEHSPLRKSLVKLALDHAHFLELHLLFRGHDVDAIRQPFASPDTDNPRLAALSGISLIGERLDETLGEPEKVKSTASFEMLVAWILHFCGFQVMLTDFAPLKGAEAPDLVAFDPLSKQGLVVEVTAKEVLNNEKLSKLARRRAEIQKFVPGTELHAVAVAAATDAFLPTELTPAAELGVILLSRGDLATLMTRAQDNDLSSTILSETILPLMNRPLPPSQ